LRSEKSFFGYCWSFVPPLVIVFGARGLTRAQGPAPETAPPLFPGGALVSYNSTFVTRPVPLGISPTVRPTLSHEGVFNFTWGFRRDFDVTVLVPVVTNELATKSAASVRGTAIGDASVLLKYRFYRHDSARGTTQASLTVGPKLPTGGTGLKDTRGNLLPATFQPGSGSTDLFAAANWTYTGLFNIRRLVADEDFHAVIRSQGAQQTKIGDDIESRFWLSYRPYESKTVGREWFIGPALTWMHSQDDRIADVVQRGSGGHSWLAGIASYVGIRPGTHVWIAADWDFAHSVSPQFQPARRHISFGITQQFRLHW
jgi:hypothetical protein